MFRSTLQKNLFTVFYSAGLDPLKDWRVQKRDGYMKRYYEADGGLLIFEMMALNTTLHYITTPKNPKQTLGIRLPIFNLLVRNLNKCFSFEVTIMDDSKCRRRFRCANYVRSCSIQMFETTVPLTMTGCDWVLIYFNLSEFTRRSYNTNYIETERVKINGNIHLRRAFFSENIIEYDKLPKDYQIIYAQHKQSEKRKPPMARPPSPMARIKPPSVSGKSNDATTDDMSEAHPLTKRSSMISVVSTKVTASEADESVPKEDQEPVKEEINLEIKEEVPEIPEEKGNQETKEDIPELPAKEGNEETKEELPQVPEEKVQDAAQN